MNLPGADADLPESGASDAAWIDFACENGIDLLAVSFVRRPSDLERVRSELGERGADIPLVAKIEKPQAAERAEEIIEAAESGIMVARGDLGVELPIEEVPEAQKRLISLAGRASKPAITATQMLATMVKASRPTRAEVTDVANAIFDGTDAVMLSEETAVGEHPVEAVRVMDRVARAAERQLPYGEWLYTRVEPRGSATSPRPSPRSRSPPPTGSTWRRSWSRPARAGPRAWSRPSARGCRCWRSPRSIATVRRMNLLFGVRAVQAEPWESLRQLLDDCAALARDGGYAKLGRPDRGHRRPPQPGAGHEPVRGPPGSLSRPVAPRPRRRC